MPQEELQVVLKAKDILKKEEFTESFKKVLELVLKMQEKQAKAIDNLEVTYASLLQNLENKYSASLNELKGGVNDLFVKGRLDEMDAGQKKQFASLKKEVNDFLGGQLKAIDSTVQKRAIPGVPGKPGPAGRPPTLEELKLAFEPMKADFQKQWEEKVQQVLSRRVIAGPSANAINIHEFGGDGTRSYEVPRHRRALLLLGTQAPFIYRSTVDFTTANRTLTIDGGIEALAAGQNFSFLYMK